MTSPRALTALAIALTLTACGDDASPDIPEQRFTPPSTEGNWILVDQIHTTKQNPDLMLRRDNYDYQGMHGYSRLFGHLESHDYPFSQIIHTQADERITPEVLQGFKVLFINLVSSDRPDFTAGELAAITAWVEGGGGLFVIADHTNVYYHAQRINPLLVPMGIEVTYHTALDSSPDFAIGGGAWIKIQNWDRDHPISEDIEIASFQTGGTMSTPHGVGRLSDQGHGDFWQEDPTDPGFYGNWRKDEGEPRGALPVVAAVEFGAGRVAVVGDQNIFGDEWIMTAHNKELALNIFEWLAKNDGVSPPLRDTRDQDAFHVGITLEHADWNIGINGCSGFFPFYINFNRTPGVIARGLLDFSKDYDALVFTDPRSTFSDDDLGRIREHLSEGKTLIMMMDITLALPGSTQLLDALVPDLVIDAVGREPLQIADLPATGDRVETVAGETEFEIFSDTLDIDGLRMSGHRYPQGKRCPEDIEASEPILRRITANIGTPFLQAELPSGERVDLARRVSVGGGEVIVFLQDGFWRNQTLGGERQFPTTRTADAHQIQYRFIDWLVAQKAQP